MSEYRTSDTGCAAAIMASHQLELKSTATEGNQTVFVFDDPHDIGTSLERKYRTARLTVPAILYRDAWHYLMRIIRQHHMPQQHGSAR